MDKSRRHAKDSIEQAKEEKKPMKKAVGEKAAAKKKAPKKAAPKKAKAKKVKFGFKRVSPRRRKDDENQLDLFVPNEG